MRNRFCQWVMLAAATTLTAPSAFAQNREIQVLPGAEVFPSVHYRGGDARFKKTGIGALVLTDSTLGFYYCVRSDCFESKGRVHDDTKPIWIVPLTKVTTASASSQNRGPSGAARMMFGVLATDQNKEYFAFTHETDSSAEAPVFETPAAMSLALEAKVRFRMKKLGKELPPE